MNYLLILTIQIAIYHIVGLSIVAALLKFGSIERKPDIFFIQLLGFYTLSVVLLACLLLGCPKGRFLPIFAAAFIASVSFIIAREFPEISIFRKSIHLSLSISDYAWLSVFVIIALYWTGLAIVTGYNIVPVGDGFVWTSKAVYWAFSADFNIAQSPFSSYPPLTTLAETANLLLLNKNEPNSGLLAIWGLHILALGICYSLSKQLSNRWTAICLVAFLSFSPMFTQNVFLGYRDALLAKWVVALSLASVSATKGTLNKNNNILVAVLFAFCALTKDEGLIFGAICLFVLGASYLLKFKKQQVRPKIISLVVCVALIALVPIGVWWIIRISNGMSGFQGQTPSLSDILANITPARLYMIKRAMLENLKTPVFGLVVLSIPLLFFKNKFRWTLQLLLILGISILFITSIYMATMVNVEWHIKTSLSRLMFTPWSLAWCFVLTVCANGLPDRLKNLTAETSAQKPANSK